MDVSLSQSIVNAATAATNAQTSNAVGVAVLKKAMDTQKAAAATLLQALPSPQPALATSGNLGTQVNAFA
jgi:redox-regulated HSP33 family molecular chaperone